MGARMILFTMVIICVIYGTRPVMTHQTSAGTLDTATPTIAGDEDDHLAITDPRFFTHKIFHKYGEGGNIPFEGFEHLMENLGLGNIDIKDHDLSSHKEENQEFRIMHESHDHPKSLHDDHSSSKEQIADANNDQHSNKIAVTAHDHDHDHDHPHSRSSKSLDRDYDAGRTIRNDARSGQDESSNHDHTSHEEYTTKSSTATHHDHDHDDDDAHVTFGTTRNDLGHGHESHHPEDHAPEQPFPELLDTRFNVVENHRYVPDLNHEAMFNQRCLSPRDILETFHFNPNASLNTVKFLLICPAIIWELDQQHCVHRHPPELKQGAVTLDQWFYSSLAVVMISLCGLFSVAVIPIMQKWFYHTLLQFLVGLAIGSLSGDALLHLLPHAMLPNDDNHQHSTGGDGMSKEETAVWKGMSALAGIYFFFVAERILNAVAAYRRQKREKAHLNSEEVIPVQEIGDPKVLVGEKLSHYRKNSYGVKIGPDGKENMQMLPYVEDSSMRRDSRHSSTHEVSFHGRSSFTADPHSGPLYYAPPPGGDQDNYVVNLSEHHGHGHGHSHEVPQSVSAVAWMVIMGDGLHNFCDGMAIGAAFASGLAGGISTTVAVFCHELPHELGDFAMLLKTGMKVKQALFYNGLSSVLCLVGMVIGLSLGSVNSATSWIFAGTAGMFIYIALVDMLPELSSANADPNVTPSYTLAVQVFGITIGVSIMLLIANYEHELVRIVS